MAPFVETNMASAAVDESGFVTAWPVTLPLSERLDQAMRYAVPVATALVLVSVILRFVAASQLWLDEALSVNISRLPLGRIPGALRHDGSPPLYYYLLHFWMQVFGEGNFAVRALSGVISVATLPLAWFAGKRVGGRRLAWASLLLIAGSPFAINYATTTRMYSLMMFWSLLGVLVLARALERPTTRRLVCLGALTAAVLYTHYWGIYLVSVTGVWLLARSRRPRGAAATGNVGNMVAAVVGTVTSPVVAAAANSGAGGVPFVAVATTPPTSGAGDGLVVAVANTPPTSGGGRRDPREAARRASWSCFMAMVCGCLLFLPWVPSFVFQTLHTGTPWSNAAGLGDILTVLGQYSGGGPWGDALGLTLFTLLLLGVFAHSVDRQQLLVQLKARREARPIVFVFMGTLVVAVVGGTIAQSAFVGRYTAVVFPLFVLLVGLGVTVFADRRVLAVVLAWTVAAGMIVAIGGNLSARTQAGQVAHVINTVASANDVVVYCPDQLGPAASRLITVAVQQYTFPRGDSPSRIDWVNYKQAIDTANVEQFADEMLSLAAGHDIWFVENSNYPGTDGKCGLLMSWFSAKRNSQLWVADKSSISLENESLVRFPE